MRRTETQAFEEFMEKCHADKKKLEEFQQFQEELVDLSLDETISNSAMAQTGGEFDQDAYEIFFEEPEASPEDKSRLESSEAEERAAPAVKKSAEEIRLEEIERKSIQLLRETSKNVAKLMNEAADEAFAIKAQAREAGFQAGREEGIIAGIQDGSRKHRQELREQYESLFQLLSEAAAQIERERLGFAQQYLEDLRDLAITVAQKVISISLRSSGHVIEKMVETAVENRRNKHQWVNISISEVDYKHLLENGIDPESLAEGSAERVRLTVVEQAEPGTCLIEFPEEIIDASVNTQMANIKKLVKSEGIQQ